MDSEQLREIEERHSRLAEVHTGSMKMEDFLYRDLPPVFMALRDAWKERSGFCDNLVIAKAEIDRLRGANDALWAKMDIQETVTTMLGEQLTNVQDIAKRVAKENEELQAEKKGNAEVYERMVVGRQGLGNKIIILRGELAEARRVNNELMDGTDVFADPDESVLLKHVRAQRDKLDEANAYLVQELDRWQGGEYVAEKLHDAQIEILRRGQEYKHAVKAHDETIEKNTKLVRELNRQLSEAWAKEERFKKMLQEYKCAYGYALDRARRIERERDLFRTDMEMDK